VEIELAVKIFQVAVAVNEPRQYGLTRDINHLGISRNSYLTAPADRLEFAGLNHDDGIVDRRPSRAVDQFPALHNEYLLCHFLTSAVDFRGLRQILLSLIAA
jgi:hypothetical protein